MKSLGVFVAGLLLALALPTVAFAANTATFSGATPKNGTASTVTSPKISVTVYDKYGVKGSTSYAMYIDGAKVKPTLSYVRGYSNHKFTLTYSVKTRLTVAAHAVKVTTHDLKSKNSTYTWSFMVDSSTPPATFSLLSPDEGSTTHDDRPALSVKVAERWDCASAGSYAMKLDGAPVPAAIAYTTVRNYKNFTLFFQPSLKLGQGSHTASVTIHDAAGRTTVRSWSFVVSAEMPIASVHAAGTAFCTRSGCHDPSLTIEHYKYLDNVGAPLTCATCHSSGDSAVLGVVASGVSDCTGCHKLANTTHPGTVSVHALPELDCAQVGCHGGVGVDLASLHSGTTLGCATCHRTGVFATATCTQVGCHDTDPHVNLGLAVSHTSTETITCTASDCHPANVIAIHTAPGGPGCLACHAPTQTRTLVCATVGCHPGGESAAHQPGLAPHDVSVSTCVSGSCHSSKDASVIHATAPAVCKTCHGGPGDPTAVCLTCHVGANAPAHSTIGDSHTATGGVCVNPQCHVTDVSLIHATSNSSCQACHADIKTASTNCSACHDTDPLVFHKHTATKHATPVGISCIADGCHFGDVAAIHAKAPKGCGTCHDPNVVATTTCTDSACHGDVFATIHAKGDAPHTPAVPNADCQRADCHSTNLVTVHQKHIGCAACHNMPGHDPSQVCSDCHNGDSTTVHNLGTKHTPPVGTCVNTAGCHSAGNVAVIHQNAPTSCASCHAAEAGPSLDCAACHVGSNAPTHAVVGTRHTATNAVCVNADCHASDVSKIHVKDGTARCFACHADNKKPSTVCADCHTEFATLAPPHPAPSDIHTSASSCASSGLLCHPSANLVTIHANVALGCQACHNGTGTLSTDCVTCHPGKHADKTTQHTAAWQSCTGAASCHTRNVITIHAQPGGPGCIACHAPGTVASTRCVNCHTNPAPHQREAASHAITASCAPSCHAATDAEVLHNFDCGRCHWQNTPPSLVCSDCHKDAGHLSLHVVVRTDTCAANGCHDASDTNLTTIHKTCDECHKSTKPGVVAAIAAGNKGCANCHGFSDHTTQHAVTRNDTCAAVAPCHGNSDTNLITIHKNNCDTCHATTASDQVKAAIAANNTGCANCHGFSDHTTQHAVTRNDTCAAVAPCHGNSDTNLITIHKGNCDTCHATTASDRVKAAIAANNTGCANCHGFSDHTTQHAVTRNDSCAAVAPCHGNSDTNLITIHKGNCDTCHATTASDQVKAAIAANNTGCANCHGFSDHTTQHAVTRNDTCAAVAPCHGNSDTNLITIHKSNCDTCHATTASDQVKAAIAANNTGCANCHGFSDHNVVHEVVRTDSCAAVAPCHGNADTNLITIHKSVCATCHADTASDQVKAAIAAKNADCANCHGFSDHNVLHEVVRMDTCAAVSPCHGNTDMNLITIHKSDCETCHADTASDAVKAAIAAKNPDCANCHGFSDHTTQHAVTRNDTCAAVAPCHGNSDTNLITIHKNNCDTCHATTASDQVKAAIAANNTGCANCHGFSDHVTQHSVVRNDSCAAVAPCHGNSDTNLITIHKSNCDTCHADTASDRVKAAIAANNTGCANCHGFSDHVSQHAVTRDDACTGAGCHDASNANLTTLHPTCATCHDSTDSNVVTAIAGNDKACSSCHPDAHAASHQWCNDCHSTVNGDSNGEHDPNLVPDQACSSCHGSPFQSLDGAAWVNDSSHHSCDCHSVDFGTPSTDLHTVVRADTCVGASCHAASNTNLTTIHPTCATCHDPGLRQAVKDAITNNNKACSACHTFTDHTSQHVVTRTDTCVGASCHVVSNANLITLHPTAGCDTCHASGVRQAVKDAITNNNKACAACHTFTDHTALHTVTRTDSCVGASCHPNTLTNLATLHPTLGCATCHDAGVRQAVKDAITAHNRNCSACHTFTDHVSQHAVTRTDTCVGATCHAASNANLTTLHPTLGCDTCHLSTVRQAVKDAITNHNKNCSACHTFTDHVSQHAVTRNDTCIGAGCHDASNANLTTLHPTCATCHDPGVRQAVKDAITNHNKSCSACHVTTISSLTLHPGYNTLHDTTGNGCTGTYCHPATALDIHGRTGCVNSCHKNAVASLTLSCNSGTCHAGVYGGSTIDSHMGIHTSPYDGGQNCVQCHSSDWHEDGNPIFTGTISAGGSCSTMPSSWGVLACHTGTPGSSGAQGWNHYNGDCTDCH
jgi:hypothetical protein